MRVARIEKPKNIELSSFDFELVKNKILEYKNKKDSIITVLQIVQNVYGFLPKDILVKVSDFLNLSLTDLYGVASFYSQFRFEAIGKHLIKVCHGTACHVQNANLISDTLHEKLKINDNETTEDGLFTVESVACLGCCSLAPVMMIGDETFGKLDEKSSKKIIDDFRNKEKNDEN